MVGEVHFLLEHAGEISQQTKKMVGDPGINEKNTCGTRDEGT